MNQKDRRIRVLIAKTGLDGHDRGAKLLLMALREEGMEVIYSGLKQTAESIVQTCMQEDVDVVGLSSLSGSHLYYFPEVTKLVVKNDMEHVLVIGGGIIPEEDIPLLEQKGVRRIFGPGTDIGEVAKFIRENVKR